MNVIAKISCYFECSVTLKLRKDYLHTDIQYTSLTPDKILNAILHVCQHIWELQTSKSGLVFWPTLYVYTYRERVSQYKHIICDFYHVIVV